jgi:hypothetical protein
LSDEAIDVQNDLKHQLLPTEKKPSDIMAPTPNELDDNTPIPASPQCSWMYFRFISASLQELNPIASAGLPENFATFVSTDDAPSAFISKSLLRAISQRLPSETRIT